MPNHEQGVCDAFNELMLARATGLGKRVRKFALSGQDALAGADYLITDETGYALIEFKYRLQNLVDESRKPRRLALCQRLQELPNMRALHDRCHFVAWSRADKIELNIYRAEICNRHIFARENSLTELQPISGSRAPISTFATEFFADDSERRLHVDEFERYLKWLLQDTSNASASTLELITSNPESFGIIKFPSVREAHNWIRRVM